MLQLDRLLVCYKKELSKKPKRQLKRAIFLMSKNLIHPNEDPQRHLSNHPVVHPPLHVPTPTRFPLLQHILPFSNQQLPAINLRNEYRRYIAHFRLEAQLQLISPVHRNTLAVRGAYLRRCTRLHCMTAQWAFGGVRWRPQFPPRPPPRPHRPLRHRSTTPSIPGIRNAETSTKGIA